MKKTFILGSLALIFGSSFINAENEQNSHVDKNSHTMVITANRVAQDINDVLAVTEVITREDIERLQPESITDLLTTVAGFDIVHNGGAGQLSSLFTRGTESDHTLVVVDGIRVGSATSGKKTFETISVAQIERIEIIKGPRATLWGSDAIGGVIQIFTRKLQAGESAASLTVGSYDYSSSSFSLGMGSGDFSNTISVSNQESDGYNVRNLGESDADGYSRTSIAIRGEYNINQTNQLNWTLQRDEGSSDFDGTFQNMTEYDNYFWNLKYSTTAERLSTQIILGQSEDEPVNFGGTATNTPKEEASLFTTKKDQVSTLFEYKASNLIQLTGGLEFYQEDISDSFSTFGGPYAIDDRKTRSGFFSSILNNNSFIAEIAIRHDDIDEFGNNQAFNIGAGYRFLDNLTLSVNRSKGFKVPTFNDLYFPCAGCGNPELESETSFNEEVILKAHWDNQSVVMAAYQNEFSQLIVLDSNFFPMNIENVEIKGYETIYSYNSNLFSHKLSLAYIDAKNLNTNTQLLLRAKKHANYQIDYDYQNFSIFAQVNYAGKRNDNDNFVLDSFVQTNLGIVYTANENWKYTFKVSDIGKEAPVTVNTYNAPGRQWFIGAQYVNF